MEKLLFYLAKTFEAWHKTTEQVAWVGSRDGAYAVSWTEFQELAKDAGMPNQDQVVIVFQDGSWMWVDEYDGSPYFRYSEMPKKMVDAHKYSSLQELPTPPWPHP